MNSAQETLRDATAGKVARKWIVLSLLVVLLSGIAGVANYSSAAAAEPDLALLKAAYAGSAINNQALDADSPLVIPAASFRADGPNRQWFFGFSSAFIYPNESSNYCGSAPVYLPNGAIVTALTAYLFDNDAGTGRSAYVYLYAKPFSSMTNATTMASLYTTVQSTTMQTVVASTINSPKVDNNNYTYYIGICLWGIDSNLRFYAAKLDYYQPKTYIPFVSR